MPNAISRMAHLSCDLRDTSAFVPCEPAKIYGLLLPARRCKWRGLRSVESPCVINYSQ